MNKLILASISAAMISGCTFYSSPDQEKTGEPTAAQTSASGAELRRAIRGDIDDYIANWRESVEDMPCEFSFIAAENLFLAVPELTQMKDVKTLSYDLESLDGKSTIKNEFARDRKFRRTETDASGKITAAYILNGDKAYVSADGILFKPETDAGIINGLRLDYDLNMDLPRHAKKVGVLSLAVYDFSKDMNSREIAQEPMEIMIDNQRAYRINVRMATRFYAADLTLYVTSNAAHRILRREVKSADGGQDKNAFSSVSSSSRFVKQGKFVFPGFTHESKNGKAVDYTVKNVQVNSDSVSAARFVPDAIDSQAK